MARLATTPTAQRAGDDLSDRLERASRELREAVIAVDHSAAERAASRYVEALQKFWESLKESERAVSPVPTTARELLGWAREMTLIQRNMAADQLTVLRKASRYNGVADSQGGLQVKG